MNRFAYGLLCILISIVFPHRIMAFDDAFVSQRGQSLIRELQCFACHQPQDKKILNEKAAPNLNEIGNRVYPSWLFAWLNDPQALRPHTTMPKMFANTESGTAERYAVTQYLTSLSGPIPLEKLNRDAAPGALRGEKLFITTGCAACHANTPNESTKPRNDDDDPAPKFDPTKSRLGHGSPTGVQSTYDLGALGSKTTFEKLQEYLLNPLKTNPHGRMPNMVLKDTDARDIAYYLIKTKDNLIANELPMNDQFKSKSKAEWIAMGKTLVTEKGCVNCHEIGKQPVREFKSWETAVANLIANKTLSTCITKEESNGSLPRYTMPLDDRTAIQKTLETKAFDWLRNRTTESETRYRMQRLMCLNCHERDGEGGLGASLSGKMKSLESADNADDVRPPTLTQIGNKATPAWLNQVLLQKGRARPWMGLRMPQYGEANAKVVAEGLSQLDHVANASKTNWPATPELITAGRKLTGKDGYGCITCHDIAGTVGGGTRGPDLALTTQRIKPEWFARWMHNPQQISPGTKMPQYFLDGKATNPMLGADPDKQIQALWAYFDLGPSLPLPSGLEPPKGVILAVKDRPEILRTFMPDGAGTRSFAIGYPGSVNLAYDGTRARLAYAWSGLFLDASPVWNNRGGNPAKLLGPKFWQADAGLPWAIGEKPVFADDVATPEEQPGDTSLSPIRFLGYSVDDKGIPTFKSKYQTVTIEETPGAIASEIASGFMKQLKVDSPGEVVWHRLGVGGNVREIKPGLIQWTASDKRLYVAHLSDASADVVLQSIKLDGQSSAVVLKFPRKQNSATIKLWSLPRDDRSLIDTLK